MTLARPYCRGLTPEGCSLNWQEVPLDGGGADWQCVQFCPQVGEAAPPAPVMTAVARRRRCMTGVAAAPPPVPLADMPAGGSCELTIFSDANFAGTSAPTSDDQPRLVDVGWKNEIASVQVQSGTWDFYSEDDYTGEAMRLPPGTYADLGQWNKRVGSFMCTQP